MLQTILSRFAGFSSFPVVILILGATALLFLYLLSASGELLAGLADGTAGRNTTRKGAAGYRPLGLLPLPFQALWNLLRTLFALLWNLFARLLNVVQSLFDGCGCGCAPIGCLMIPFALLGALFGGDGGDDSDSDGGDSRNPSSVGGEAGSTARAVQEERARSRRIGAGAAVGAVGAVGSRAARAVSGAVSGVAEAARGSHRPTDSTLACTRKTRAGQKDNRRRWTRMVGKSASIPSGQSRVQRTVSSANAVRRAVADAAGEVKENVKAAVGASTDSDYFGDLPERRAFASAWTITDVEDARDIAEILAEHGIEHSWQIDDATGLPTVTIPNYTADKASETLGAYGFDVGEGMPADFISVDRVGDAPDGTTVYDPETDEWVTPGWGEDVPALEERAVYDPDAGAMYDPVTDSHFDEETRTWYGADGAPFEPDAEYAEAEAADAGGEAAHGELPALPAPNDEPDFYWGPHPESVSIERDKGDGEVVDGHATQ